MMNDFVIYKLISLCTLIIWTGLWRFFFKNSFSIRLAIFIFIVSMLLIAAYPTIVFACEICSAVYAVQYIILATAVFFLLLIPFKLFRFFQKKFFRSK